MVPEHSTGSTSAPTGGPRSLWAAVRIINVRLRFVVLMVVVGLIAAKWETLMNYVDRWRRPAPTAAAMANVEYFCPMHPSVVRDAPGSCPICGMPLSKRDRTAERVLPAGVLAQVQLTPFKIQTGRIAATPIEYRLLSREIRTVGTVDYDETRRAFVAARIGGRLDRLFVNYVGQHVDKGGPLASIYSPDLLVAQEELLTARRNIELMRGGGESARATAESLMRASRQKLALWGITDKQIEEILRRGSPETHLTIFSPIPGIVTEKKVLEGRYVSEGDDLYTIADLSVVWMQARIFEDQFAEVRVGQAVEVTSTAYPTEIFAGRISFIAYTVDPSTRTIAARVEVGNPELKLRPGMYVTATIRMPVGEVVELTPTTQRAPVNGPDTAQAELSSIGIDSAALARAYLRLASDLSRDRTDAATPFVQVVVEQSRRASPAEKELVDRVLVTTRRLAGRDLSGQRAVFRKLSDQMIALLRLRPAAGVTLFVAHCPMVNANWIQSQRAISNPYDSGMPRCGEITAELKITSPGNTDRFATGYYCPIYPDRLFDQPAECPIDKFPLKFVRVEKVLAVPEPAVINTGTRFITYRESAPGMFDMLEIEVGPRAGDYYPVLSGLGPADRVASAGAFLVDAENRLNPGASAIYFGATGSPQGDDHGH